MAWEDRGRGRTSAYGEGRGERKWGREWEGEREGEREGVGANEGAVIQRHTERMREEGTFEKAHFFIMQQEMHQRVANLAKRM